MADINLVALTGRLTRDPELRYSKSGDPVCSLRIAVNGRRRTADGKWEDQANFVSVSVWGNQAESCNQYLTKGRRIGVQGRLQYREWKAQDGSRRESLEVAASDITFLDRKDEEPGIAKRQPSAIEQALGANDPDDDIPF
jgi:single-strand DNA-binding protein